MNIQLSVFDFVPGYKINYELRKQRKMIKDFDLNYLSFWYFLTPYKCCGCYPKLKIHWEGLKDLNYCQCENCGRRTPYFDDYSWIHTKNSWIHMMKELKND